MKFIEVKPGLSIRIDSIESFEDNGNGTKIFMRNREIDSDIPYIDFVFKVAQPGSSLSAYDEIIKNIDKNVNTVAKTSQML